MIHVRFSRRFVRELDRADGWWQANRPKAPDLLLDEIDAARLLLLRAPLAGEVWRTSKKGHTIRRLLLEKTHYHVHYQLDESGDVVLLCLWGAVRGRGPRL